MRWSTAWLLMCGLFFGCGSATDEETTWLDWDDGKSDGSGRTMSTGNLNAAMWQGYDPVFDRVTPNRCLDVGDVRLAPTEPRFQVPSLRYIETRDQLAEELGIDVDLSGSIGIARADLNIEFLDRFSRTDDTVTFVLRVTEDYAVLRRPGGGTISLDDRGRQLLESDELNAFVSECGTHYINGVRYGASIDVLLTFRATDEKHVRNLALTLGASAVTTPLALDASAKQDLEETSDGLDLSITASTRGFTHAVSEDLLGNLSSDCRDILGRVQGEDGTTSERVNSVLSELVENPDDGLRQLFTHVECLTEVMHQSVTAEAEQCRGDAAECGLGDASPVEVVLEEYRAARAGDLAEALDRVEAQRQRTGRVLTDIAAVRARTRAAYYNEIAPFMRTAAENKAMYTIAGAPPATLQDLQAAADAWAAQFSPVEDARGTVDRDVSRVLEDCSARSSNDVFHDCLPDGLDEVEDISALGAAIEALTQYQDEARVVQLQVVVGPEALNYSLPGVTDALEFCESLGPGYRLPTDAEVPELDLLVRQGPVPDHSMWIWDAGETCPASGAFYDPDGEPTVGCSVVGQRGAVCVAPQGLLPNLPSL